MTTTSNKCSLCRAGKYCVTPAFIARSIDLQTVINMLIAGNSAIICHFSHVLSSHLRHSLSSSVNNAVHLLEHTSSDIHNAKSWMYSVSFFTVSSTLYILDLNVKSTRVTLSSRLIQNANFVISMSICSLSIIFQYTLDFPRICHKPSKSFQLKVVSWTFSTGLNTPTSSQALNANTVPAQCYFKQQTYIIIHRKM